MKAAKEFINSLQEGFIRSAIKKVGDKFKGKAKEKIKKTVVTKLSANAAANKTGIRSAMAEQIKKSRSRIKQIHGLRQQALADIKSGTMSAEQGKAYMKKLNLMLAKTNVKNHTALNTIAKLSKNN